MTKAIQPKFDWDEHEGQHVLDVANTKVLFVFNSRPRLNVETNKVMSAYKGQHLYTANNINRLKFTKTNSELRLMAQEDLSKLSQQLKFSRIVLEDMDNDPEKLKDWLEFLDEKHVVEAKLYVTYRKDATVFVMKPADGEGEIAQAIKDLAAG